MKPLRDTINEAAIKYQMSDNYKEVAKKVCDEIQSLLPSWNDTNKNKGNEYY